MTTSGRANNFDFLRFVPAVAVIFSHSFALLRRDNENEPLMRLTGGQITAGALAVAGFFILSGFLSTKSRLRSPSLGNYLRPPRRAPSAGSGAVDVPGRVHGLRVSYQDRPFPEGEPFRLALWPSRPLAEVGKQLPGRGGLRRLPGSDHFFSGVVRVEPDRTGGGGGVAEALDWATEGESASWLRQRFFIPARVVMASGVLKPYARRLVAKMNTTGRGDVIIAHLKRPAASRNAVRLLIVPALLALPEVLDAILGGSHPPR